MNVFVDYHHDALYRSFELLFEKRLGWNLYRPIGYEWYRNLCWRYSDNPAVVEQYLKIPENAVLKDGIYYIPNQRYGTVHKCLTFERFKEFPIDIMIASIHDHEVPYHTLCGLHFNKPKFIRQVGNVNELIDFSIVKNVMFSAGFDPMPKDVNVVYYHQEFDLDHFNFEPPTNRNTIKNFMNCLPDSEFYYLWKEYKKELSDFNWKMHGILGEDGILGKEMEIVKAMKDTTFIWHVKAGVEGYGHVIHNAYALGRPVITKISNYKGKMAEPLLEDLVTCIDLDKRTTAENVKIIRKLAQPEEHNKFCERAYQRFCEVVNFDEEFNALKHFLERVLS